MERDTNTHEQKETPSSPFFRVWLCGPFRVERLVGWQAAVPVYEVVRSADWSGSNCPRLLLKALLSLPRRQARREALLEMLWPDVGQESAVQNFHIATTKLRKVLKPETTPGTLLLTEENATWYRLEGQDQIWVDVDAALAALDASEHAEGVLCLLEQTEKYLGRGGLLEEEEGSWATTRRATIDRARKRSRLLLASAYRQEKHLGKAEAVLNLLLEEDPTDEDVVCRLMELYHQQRMTHQALRLYEQTCQMLEEDGLEPTAALKDLAECLRSEKQRPDPTLSDSPLKGSAVPQEAQITDTNAMQQRITACTQQKQCPDQFMIYIPIATYADLETDGTKAFSDSEFPLADIMQSYRRLLQGTLSQACTIFTLSPNIIIHSESSKQLMRAVIQPSHVNSDTLEHLSVITREYWEMIDNAPFDFLSDMLRHFQAIMRLLKETHSTPLYRSLCSFAGEHALVIGRTLYDMREYSLSLSYCTFSVKIAQEIGNNDLRATGLGRMALILLYARQSKHANLYLHEAQQICLQRPWIGAWLCAIEAELHAHAGNWDAFTKAMETSKSILVRYPVDNDVYASITRFSSSMQLGFEGACFLRLKQPSAAVPVLQQSLSSLHPSSLRRRSTLLTDIGMAYALQGDVKEACSHFHQALDIISQTKALIAFQRMYSAQRKLDQWKHDPQVEALAQHITNTVVIIGRTNNG